MRPGNVHSHVNKRAPGISLKYMVAIVPLLEESVFKLLFPKPLKDFEFFKSAFGLEIFGVPGILHPFTLHGVVCNVRFTKVA